jgi:hypothetical protein
MALLICSLLFRYSLWLKRQQPRQANAIRETTRKNKASIGNRISLLGRKEIPKTINVLQKYMAFIRKKGRTKIMWLPWTTGQTTAKGGLVVFSSGRLIPATSSTACYSTAGVAVKAITSASDEYTTADNIPVEVPIEAGVEWEAAVTATLVVGDVGLHCDLTDQSTVSRASSTYDIVQITKFISTTKCWCILNIGTGAITGQT